MTSPSFRDVEMLSAFLDGQLSPSDSARLEARLKSEADLRAVLDDLRRSRTLLRRLPERRAPRSFILTPKMAGLKPPAPRLYPILRFASALATLLFAVSIAVNGLTPLAARELAPASAPAFGMGGGGGGPAATEAPAAPFAQLAPTETAPADSARAASTPAAESLGKSAGSASGQAGALPSPRNEAPIPVSWQIGLALFALACGAAAWSLYRAADRRIRQSWQARK
jgi:anti-sigma factor RsiW